MEAFRYIPDVKYRTGGVYETTHQFSLVNQSIQVNKNGKFNVRFPNIWIAYKLPKVKEPEIYAAWLDNHMQFWQNQLNFAVWCATSGCGVSKYDHLRHKDPMIRSVFRFHAYYQIRRILKEMECPLPTDEAHNPINNHINMNAYEKLCNEFGVRINTSVRQKLDNWNGMGVARFDENNNDVYKKSRYHKRVARTGESLRKITIENFTAETSANYWDLVGNGPHHFSARFYILLEQSFRRQSDTVDTSSDGNPMSAIGSFVCDYGQGFTQAGITRINDSIRTYVWAILGAQSQTRTFIVPTQGGVGDSPTAQRQFLANVETAINSAVDIPESIKRYQDTLGYARSKVDFVAGFDLYMMPSDMNLYIGKINGYNNLILDASESDTTLVLGYNGEVNDSPPIQVEPTPPSEDDTNDKLQDEEPEQGAGFEVSQDELSVESYPAGFGAQPQDGGVGDSPTLTHEERKLFLILGGGAAISSLFWLSR